MSISSNNQAERGRDCMCRAYHCACLRHSAWHMAGTQEMLVEQVSE